MVTEQLIKRLNLLLQHQSSRKELTNPDDRTKGIAILGGACHLEVEERTLESAIVHTKEHFQISYSHAGVLVRGLVEHGIISKSCDDQVGLVLKFETHELSYFLGRGVDGFLDTARLTSFYM